MTKQTKITFILLAVVCLASILLNILQATSRRGNSADSPKVNVDSLLTADTLNNNKIVRYEKAMEEIRKAAEKNTELTKEVTSIVNNINKK